MHAHVPRVVRKTAIVFLIIGLLGTTAALALPGPGGPDPTFDDNGLQTTDYLAKGWFDIAWDTLVQPDGKILVVGEHYDPAHVNTQTRDIMLARYNDDGSLDDTFHNDGMRIVDLGGAERGLGIALQSSGKIVFSALTCEGGECNLAVVRTNAAGFYDSTFNGGLGYVLLNVPASFLSDKGGLAVQSDDKIVVGTTIDDAAEGGLPSMLVARVTANGTLDNTFSSDGKVKFSFGSNKSDRAADLALRGGKVVIVGESCGATDCNFAVARLDSSGKLDKTFNGTGRRLTSFGGVDSAYGVAIQSNGRIVAVGARKGLSSVMAVARYNTDGTLDADFSGDGKRTIPLGTSAEARGVIIADGGTIVIGGIADNGTNDDYAAARLKARGGLDATFDDDGKTQIDFGTAERAHSLAVQPADGKYVLAGASDGLFLWDFSVLRLLP